MLRTILNTSNASYGLDANGLQDDHGVMVAGIRLVGYQHIQASVKVSIICTLYNCHENLLVLNCLHIHNVQRAMALNYVIKRFSCCLHRC